MTAANTTTTTYNNNNNILIYNVPDSVDSEAWRSLHNITVQVVH